MMERRDTARVDPAVTPGPVWGEVADTGLAFRTLPLIPQPPPGLCDAGPGSKVPPLPGGGHRIRRWAVVK